MHSTINSSVACGSPPVPLIFEPFIPWAWFPRSIVTDLELESMVPRTSLLFILARSTIAFIRLALLSITCACVVHQKSMWTPVKSCRTQRGPAGLPLALQLVNYSDPVTKGVVVAHLVLGWNSVKSEETRLIYHWSNVLTRVIYMQEYFNWKNDIVTRQCLIFCE